MRSYSFNRRYHLSYAILVAFAVVSFGGQGLHLIPGLGHSCSHFAGCSHCCADPSSDVDCSHDDCLFHAGSAPGDHCDSDENACPICHFFALAKNISAISLEIGKTAVLPANTIWVDSFLTDNVPSFYHSRAPPVSMLAHLS